MRKDPFNSPIPSLLVALLMLGVVAIGVYTHFAGPCSVYKYSKSGDVPARCIKEFKK